MAKSFKNLISEVAQPKSGEEKAFKDQHTVIRIDAQPAGQEHIFKGTISTKERLADYMKGEDEINYDLAYSKRKVDGAFGLDDVEESYVYEADEPASPDEKSMAMKQCEFIEYVGREICEHLEADKEFPEWMQNKLSALHEKAKDMHSTLGAHGGDDVKEEAELDEAAPKISKGKAKGSIKATGLRGKGMKKFDVDVSVNNGKFEFRISDESGKFQTVGIKQAARMLGESVEDLEQIDELDKKTLGSYITKASKSAAHKSGMAYRRFGRGTRQDDRAGDELEAKSNKRLKGIATAAKKLAKEEVEELDEISKDSVELQEAMKFKAGNMRLNDGSTVKVSAQDAKLLTQMFKDLDNRNQKEMGKVLMTDKAGFNEIVGFAREAL